MNRRDIASLAFKLAGIYALIQALEQIQFAAYILFGNPLLVNNATVIVGAAASIGSVMATGCILIVASQNLAKWMFPEEVATETPRIRAFTLQSTAFSVVGVYLAATSAPPLLDIGIQILIWPGGFRITTVLYPAAKFVVGIGIFVGGPGLARVWAKLRYAGIRREMGLCIRCGYDLTGNVSGTCPECGLPIDNEEIASAGPNEEPDRTSRESTTP